jgi:hypothetical protein
VASARCCIQLEKISPRPPAARSLTRLRPVDPGHCRRLHATRRLLNGRLGHARAQRAGDAGVAVAITSPQQPQNHVAAALAFAAHRAEAVDRRLVQANKHLALVGRIGGPRLRVGRQSRFDRCVGFGGDP